LVFLSIIIPAFNEERRLPATLERVVSFVKGKDWPSYEIVVVDDGSTDGTCALVEEWHGYSPAVRLLRNPGNRGKGFAVRHGMLEAAGELRLFSDADLSAPIEDVDKLLAALDASDGEIAFGSRAVDRSLVNKHQGLLREASGRFFNLAMRTATGLPYRDTQCGFKLFTAHAAREVFARTRLDGFGFDVEALFVARQLGLRAVEVPVRWANVEGSKVSLRKGLDAFADIVRVRRNGLAGLYK
jgi:dolichyl-phosphate beta-glucosyltransferase